MKEYKSHPLSEIFPLMPVSDIKELSDDIKQRGLQNTITLYENQILDGRHRYEACSIAGVKPRFEIYKGKDPLGFVIAANLKRRHLTTSQKAMVAASIENLPQGRPEIKDANLQIHRASAAEAMTVSPRSVATASKILDESPRLAAQVRDGKITVHAAAQKLADKRAEKEVQKDAIGIELPDKCVEFWDRKPEVQELLTAVSRVRSAIKAAAESEDELWRDVNCQKIIIDLSNAYDSLHSAIPYAVCPTCNGRLTKCTLCKGRGYLSHFAWNMYVPSEVKEIRKKVGGAK